MKKLVVCTILFITIITVQVFAADPTKGTLRMSGDNTWEAYIGGEKVGQGADWQRLFKKTLIVMEEREKRYETPCVIVDCDFFVVCFGIGQLGKRRSGFGYSNWLSCTEPSLD